MPKYRANLTVSSSLCCASSRVGGHDNSIGTLSLVVLTHGRKPGDVAQHGKHKCSGFPRTSPSNANDITLPQAKGNGYHLNRRRVYSQPSPQPSRAPSSTCSRSSSSWAEESWNPCRRCCSLL